MSINRHFHQCLINKGIIVAVNHDLFVLFYFFSMSSTHMRKSIGHDCFDCHTKRHFKTIPIMPRECQSSVDRPIYVCFLMFQLTYVGDLLVGKFFFHETFNENNNHMVV